VGNCALHTPSPLRGAVGPPAGVAAALGSGEFGWQHCCPAVSASARSHTLARETEIPGGVGETFPRSFGSLKLRLERNLVIRACP
jgi:hypothetical protein